jgi:NADH:ubiquinone reductase (non-electrogenic)
MAVGAETQTFNIPGVREHSVFMKELHDAEKFQDRFIDCVESAAFPGQSEAEIDRLLHAVVVGGGPTGIELRYIPRRTIPIAITDVLRPTQCRAS